jgi:glycosyltransferase involved in cell wall biosynthesis
MRRCDAVVTISEAARAGLAAKFPEISVEIIPNGVDEALFTPEAREAARAELGMDDTTLHVVTVGRLTAVKRLDVFVAALSALAHRGIEVRGWIVGDGELRARIEADVAADPALAGRVTCVGRRTQPEVARWIAAADAFVLTSAGETGGNVVLEAMSCGVCVVSTPVGWAADYLSSGENGMMVPVGDVDALADTLSALAADPARRRALGEAGHATIAERELHWRGCASRYVRRYRELTEAGQ